MIRAFAAELAARNRDNVTRTASYLELYAYTREHPPELPWLLMAHVVSRNAGYSMSDLARRLAASNVDHTALPSGSAAGRAQVPAIEPVLAPPMRSLFALLERGNFLIFYDAWHHVCAFLAGDALAPPRTPVFMCEAWQRFAAGASDERALVLDLVHNEQNLIERRAVHHPELLPGLRLLELVEATGRERSMIFPCSTAEIKVGGFAHLDRRIATGARIFDEVIADRPRRDAIFAWCTAHPHTGSREVYGGPPGPTVTEAWPLSLVQSLWPPIHSPPALDPL